MNIIEKIYISSKWPNGVNVNMYKSYYIGKIILPIVGCDGFSGSALFVYLLFVENLRAKCPARSCELNSER